MRRSWRAWEEVGASPRLVRQIRFGSAVPWKSDPSLLPRRFANAYPLSPPDLEFAYAEVDRYLAAGYVRELSFAEARRQHHVSPSFVVRGHKPRLVVDYSTLNDNIAAPPFRMETLLDLAPQLHPNDALLKFDLQDGYYHLSTRPQDRTHLCFRVGRRYFLPVSHLCGLASTPFVFTKFLRPFVKELRRMGHRIIAYLDDVGGAPRITVADSPHAHPSDVAVAAQEVHALAARLGIHIHPVKQDFHGSTHLELLGIVVDTRAGLYLLSPAKLRKVRASALAVLRESRRGRRLVSARHLRSFAGLAQSTALAVTDARLRLRTIWDCLAEADRHKRPKVRLSHAAGRDVMFWVRLRDNPIVGRAIWEPQTGSRRTLHSDASQSGWGAVLDRTVPARGMFAPAELPLHINEKELLAVIYSVLSFADRLRPGEHIQQWVDSAVASANVRNWTSRSPVALALLRILRRLLEDLGLSMATNRLPSVLNLLSDRLSRSRPADDWALSMPAAASVADALGTPSAHHFATAQTALTPRYTSRLADPFALGRSLDAVWEPQSLLTPPPHALPLVVARLERERPLRALIVAPDWPAQPWHNPLVRMSQQSWLLPAPAWVRPHDQAPSPWAARAFLVADLDLPLRQLTSHSLSQNSRPLLDGRELHAAPDSIDSHQLPEAERPRGSWELLSSPARRLPTNATGGSLSGIAAATTSPRCLPLPLRSPRISDICLTAAASLPAVYASTLRPSVTATCSSATCRRLPMTPSCPLSRLALRVQTAGGAARPSATSRFRPPPRWERRGAPSPPILWTARCAGTPPSRSAFC